MMMSLILYKRSTADRKPRVVDDVEGRSANELIGFKHVQHQILRRTRYSRHGQESGRPSQMRVSVAKRQKQMNITLI